MPLPADVFEYQRKADRWCYIVSRKVLFANEFSRAKDQPAAYLFNECVMAVEQISASGTLCGHSFRTVPRDSTHLLENYSC